MFCQHDELPKKGECENKIMEVSQIIELINAVSESEVEELSYEENGVSLKIRKRPKMKHPHPPLDHPDGPHPGCMPPDHGPMPPYPPFGGMYSPGQGQQPGAVYPPGQQPGGASQGYPGPMQPGFPASAGVQPGEESGNPTAKTVPESAPAAKEPGVSLTGNVVKSPLVGTFYCAASPDAEPFVAVGDTVRKGQVLGIVEAMKLMNEIESDFEGEIVQILVKNGDMVEFDQPLFLIR